MQTLLLVDDDETFRARLGRALSERGFEVTVAGSGEEALAVAPAPIEQALIDLKMPGMGGLELLRQLLARHPEARIVVLTGYGSIPTAVEAMRLGAVNYLVKPADADAIISAFEGATSALEAEPDYHAPSLARTEWEHIQRALTDCEGNITKAAQMLGLHRRTLQRKLQKNPPRR